MDLEHYEKMMGPSDELFWLLCMLKQHYMMPLETGQSRTNEVKHVKLLLISDLPYVSKLCGIRSFDSPQLIVWLLLAEVYSA